MSDLRELRRAWMALAPDTPHVEEEAWERWACGEMAEAEEEVLLEHVNRCPECADVYRALKLLAAEARSFDPGAPDRAGVKRRRLTAGTWAVLAAAAALVLAVGLVALLGPSVGTPQLEDELRTEAVPEPLEPTFPIGSLERPPDRFRWVARVDARAYTVELLDAEGEPLWTSEETGETTIPWPASVSPAVSTRYYWRVTAWAPDGGTSAVSPLVDFDLP